jgi:DNA-binding FadR family transcriptional regulator
MTSSGSAQPTGRVVPARTLSRCDGAASVALDVHERIRRGTLRGGEALPTGVDWTLHDGISAEDAVVARRALRVMGLVEAALARRRHRVVAEPPDVPAGAELVIVALAGALRDQTLVPGDILQRVEELAEHFQATTEATVWALGRLTALGALEQSAGEPGTYRVSDERIGGVFPDEAAAVAADLRRLGYRDAGVQPVIVYGPSWSFQLVLAAAPKLSREHREQLVQRTCLALVRLGLDVSPVSLPPPMIHGRADDALRQGLYTAAAVLVAHRYTVASLRRAGSILVAMEQARDAGLISPAVFTALLDVPAVHRRHSDPLWTTRA